MGILDMMEAFHILVKCWDLGIFQVGSQSHLHSASGREKLLEDHVWDVARSGRHTHHLCSHSVVRTLITGSHMTEDQLVVRRFSLILCPRRRKHIKWPAGNFCCRRKCCHNGQLNFGQEQRPWWSRKGQKTLPPCHGQPSPSREHLGNTAWWLPELLAGGCKGT